MIQNRLDQQKLRRTSPEQWLSPGSHLLTRSWMTASTTQCPSWTPPKARGPRWLTGSSITSLQSATSCKGGSITSESMPKMTWASLHHRSLQPGGWRRRKVIFYISNNLKEQKTRDNNVSIIPCREVCDEHASTKGSWRAVSSSLYCTTEASQCAQRLRVLHELCGDGKPQTSHHVVQKSHQFKHRHQLLHLQHLWGVFLVNSSSGAQRHGQIHHHGREHAGTGRKLHRPQCQGWEHAAKPIPPADASESHWW